MKSYSTLFASSVVLWTFQAIGRVSAASSLPFSWSYPRQCTPINVTFTPEDDGFPYSVYILGIGSNVQSFLIDQNYQPGAKQITFQYSVPQNSQYFSSFMISIADSKGNGNTSSILPVNIDDDGPKDCGVYAETSAFVYASDSTVGLPGDRPECTALKYYPISPFRGTAPFSFSLVPIGGVPITVNLPQSSLTNSSYFLYRSVLPFAAGTQFYQFMSDGTGGGSGGGSQIYTVTASAKETDPSCTTSGYRLANQNTTNSLPLGLQTATFQNLKGALPLNHLASKGSSHGGLIGGIIGAVIGVGGILVIIGAYLIYRRRQKRKRELERKEQPQFVDLDDDDYSNSNGNAGVGGTGRRGQSAGVQQSYSVSPFTYQPADTSPNPLSNASGELMPFNETAEMGSGVEGYSSNNLGPMSTTTSEFNASTRHSTLPPHEGSSAEQYTGAFFLPSGSSTMNSQQTSYPSFRPSDQQHAPPSSSWQNSARPGGQSRQMSGEFNSIYSGHSLAHHQPLSPMESEVQAAGEAYPMRSTTGGPRSTRGGASSSVQHGQPGRERNLSNGSGAGSATSSAPMPFEVMLGDARDTRRNTYMQHQDAGPVRPEDYMEEMPPSYGQWITPPAGSTAKDGTQGESK